jgi:uncharacterized membrane protein YhaH (DUF805 family)
VPDASEEVTVPELSAFQWMVLPLRRYAQFSGRSRRKEYWMFFLLYTLALVSFAVALGAELALTGRMALGGLAFVVVGIAALAALIPALAVQVRRFHDQNRTGWFALLTLIPYIGGIIILGFMLIDGTPGPNKYGPDPKGRTGPVGGEAISI